MKQLKLFKKLFKWMLLFFIIMGAHNAFSQDPVYKVELRNDVQISSNTLQFDVYLLNTGIPTFEFATMQMGITFNSAIKNGGTPIVSFVKDISSVPLSDLNASQKYTDDKLTIDSTKNIIRVTAMTPPGAGNGTIISSTSPGTLVCRIRLTNSVDFTPNTNADLTWAWITSTDGYPTKSNAYVNGINVQITGNTSGSTYINQNYHTTDKLANPLLNVYPAIFALTGNGSYCQGGTGLNINLSGSELGVSYQLIKNGLPIGSSIPGTGSPLVWQNNTSGTYIVSATRNGTLFTDTMTGTVTVTEVNGVPVAAGPIVGNTLACQGSNEMYIIPAITNADSYVWNYSGTNVSITGNKDTVYLSYSANATSGNLIVKGVNGCGEGPSSSPLVITVNNLPGAAGTITGTSPVSPGDNNIPYSVPAITGATTYIWTYSGTGATINNGTTNSITINFGANATPGYLTVKGANNCGEGTISPQYTINVNSVPAAAGTIQGNASVCQGVSNIMYYVGEILGASSYNWSYTGTGATINSTAGDTIYVSFAANATSGNLTVYGSNIAGNGAVSPAFAITVGTPPANASGIVGNTSVCKNTTQWFKVSPIAGATSYHWTLPTGATGTSSIDSINVSFSSSAVNGKIYVYGQNTCGIGASDSLSITINTVPGAAGSITGTATLCQGTNGVTYTVAAISGSTSYTWTVPTNATIVGSSNTNSITLNFGSTAQSGNITVKGENQCGFGATSSQFITVNPLPGTPTSMTGADSVCQGSTGNVYSIAPLSNTGTNGYVWTLPTGFTGTSSTNSITITVASSATTGVLKIKGTNGCGSGQEFSKTIVVKALPSTPGTITGPNTLCKGTNNTYKITPVANATSYIWSLPNGVTGTSTVDSIVVAVGSTAVSGNITVKGVNACGEGPVSTLAITVKDIPAAAGTITGSASACQGSANNVYSVPLISEATSYTWTLPQGITGTSTSNAISLTLGTSFTSGIISVVGTNLCGNGAPSTFTITGNSVPNAAGTITGNDNICQGQTGLTYSVPVITGATSYTWTLPSGFTGTSTTNTITVDAGTSATSGNVTVKGNNTCGSGTASSKAITVQLLPANAGVITGPITACKGTNGTYTVPAIANATSYTWTLPSGVTGSSTTNTITVNFTSTAVSGNISVKGINSCGEGNASSYLVIVYNTPAAAGTISGPTTLCGNQTGVTYTVPPINDATSYVWTLPNGFTGTSNTNTITVNIAASASSGNITVKGVNSCGDGTASSLNVTVNAYPASAGTISGPISVCQGETNVTYTVPAIANATSYVWTLPNGFTGTSSTNSITVSVATSATNGTIEVKGTNSCGDGASSSLAITVNTLPTTPGNITGTSTISQAGQPYTYQVVPVANATDYVWEYTGTNATISGTGNSVTVTFAANATPGNLRVKAHNACGYSASSPNFPISITIGIEETDIASVSIYPNPNRGKFNIDLAGIKHDVILTVYDAQGKVFYNELINKTTPEYSKIMDLSSVKAGLYFVKISSDNMTKVEKIIIQ